MPYKDPEKQKAAKRASAKRLRDAAAGERAAEALAAGALDKVLPEPPDEDELIRLLGVQARLGSVQAAKLLLDRIEKEKRADSSITDSDPLAGIDELAARRAA